MVILPVCLFLLVLSCPAQAYENDKSVKLELKFNKGQSENYRLKTVAQRKVSIEGARPENSDGFHREVKQPIKSKWYLTSKCKALTRLEML